MAHRGVCPDMACQRVAIELERQASERRACQVVAVELGIPLKTVLTWIYRDKVTSKDVTNAPSKNIEKETSTITDLHTLTFDSGRKKISFELVETDGNRLLAMQEYRVAAKGKESATKHRLIIPLDLIAQFREAMEGIEALIKAECSEEPEVVGSDHEEDDRGRVLIWR